MDEAKQSPTDVIRAAAADLLLIRLRTELACFAADCFFSTGEELHVLGHIVGPDRATGVMESDGFVALGRNGSPSSGRFGCVVLLERAAFVARTMAAY
jgi:hypothetical protein